MDWITDQVAIGNIFDARAVRPHDVDAVLCLLPGCSCEERIDLDAFAVPLIDGSGNDPRRFEGAVDFISEVCAAGSRILVHCQAGRSRSVVAVAGYLMRERHLTRATAFAIIEARRTVCVTPGLDSLLHG